MLKTCGALALSAAALLWSGAALADQCGSGRFNGAYIGASVGYAGLDTEQRPLGDPKLSNDDSGVSFGGYVGYNIQCGRIVFGAEGDLSYLGLEATSVDAAGASFTSKVDALGTLRGRLGVAIHDDILLYATAGIAWADRTHHLIDPAAPGGPFDQSDSDWATGYVIGGGVEFLRHDRWTLRAEVLWTDLGSENRTYACGAGCTTEVKWDDDVLTARVGLGLKLGGPEPRYEPLK